MHSFFSSFLFFSAQFLPCWAENPEMGVDLSLACARIMSRQLLLPDIQPSPQPPEPPQPPSRVRPLKIEEGEEKLPGVEERSMLRRPGNPRRNNMAVGESIILGLHHLWAHMVLLELLPPSLPPSRSPIYSLLL
ncbi:hypothetical protein BDD12DRAFT_141322 [Trichophaea hybrida]|nr:hypothetical protein BDD12DRAFT_141322 [Trichophaea hybrida]